MNELRRGASAASAIAWVLTLAWAVAGPPALAHIEFGAKTLPLLVAGADVVARARIVDARGVSPDPGSSLGRPTVRAELLEVFKGDAQPGAVRFAQHGHGVATYENGEEVLLFLRRAEHSAELSGLAGAGLAYVSVQEHDEKYLVGPKNAGPLFAAVRTYVQAPGIPEPELRLEALRQATLVLLTSGDPRLFTSALLGLTLAEDVPLITSADLPTLEPLLDDPALAIGMRLALLVELERRGLTGGPARWLALLDNTDGAARTAVIRAAGRHPGPEIASALLALLDGPDAVAAREAAISLGWPGNRAAVAPLDAALTRGDRPLRLAAIRGLGRIGTPEARGVLAETAAAHPDPETRRRARAEVALLSPPAPESRP